MIDWRPVLADVFQAAGHISVFVATQLYAAARRVRNGLPEDMVADVQETR